MTTIILIIAILALGLSIYNFLKGRNMATASEIKVSLQASVDLAVEAMNNSSQAITGAVAKLQELKGTIPDDTWLGMAQSLDTARQSNVAATAAIESEMSVTTGASGT